MCVYSTEGKSNPLGVTSSQAWWCSVKCIGCGPMLRVGNPQHSPKHRQGWHVVCVSGKEGWWYLCNLGEILGSCMPGLIRQK